MPKLKIITGKDNPILRTMSVPVKKFDGALKKLIKGMAEAMLGADGIGIAAPQVGMNLRVFLVTLDLNTKGERIVAMVNPIITWKSEETEMGEEGCLSLPKQFGDVERHKSVVVEYFGVDGARQELSLEGLNAREVQHENDHLDAILFIDRMVDGGRKRGEVL